MTPKTFNRIDVKDFMEKLSVCLRMNVQPFGLVVNERVKTQS